MTFKKDLRQLGHPYYFLNILLSVAYLVLKKAPVICEYAFPNWETKCELDGRETEILFFLMIVIAIRTRKTGSTTMITYLSSSFMYAKVANGILFFYADIIFGWSYVIISTLVAVFFPEPTYAGPENITYFRGAQGLQDELDRDRSVNWIVTFYTVWNPACTNLAPIFSHLSADYHTEKLRFGKVDIGRWPDAAKKHGINDAPTSKQLPTIIHFKEGREVLRRPTADSNRKLQKFFFSEDNIRVNFDLNNLYQDSKKTERSGDSASKKRQ